MSDKKIIPQVLPTYTEGAIIADCWGCEQTNYDYYVIIERNGDWVTVLPLKKNSSNYDSVTMTSKENPGEIDYSKRPIRKKIKKHNGKEIGFTFRNYSGGGWANLWDGKTKTASHYA